MPLILGLLNANDASAVFDDSTDILDSGGYLLLIRQSAVTNTNSINIVSYAKSNGTKKPAKILKCIFSYFNTFFSERHSNHV
jgi:hypothetical protein